MYETNKISIMKKLFVTIGSMMLLSVCSMAQIQDRDTTATNINDRGGVQETREEMQEEAREAGNKARQGAESTGNAIEEGAEQAGDKIQETTDRAANDVNQAAETTDQELEKDAKQMEEVLETASIDKEGPNGEKLFVERGKYFYYNEDGKKVKVKKSNVRDKSVEEKTIKNNK
jgi:hypothetical protein